MGFRLGVRLAALATSIPVLAHAVTFGAPVQITTNLGDDRNVDWSPDGMYLIYEQYPEGEFNPDIVKIPATGGSPVDVVVGTTFDYEPAWSPDNTVIGFRRSIDIDASRIYTTPVAGGPALEVTNHDGTQREPSWAPGGDKFVYGTNHLGPGGRRDVIVHDIATGDELVLTPVPSFSSDPAWSPLGDQIVFYENATANLFLVPATGGAIRPLTNHGATERHPDFSPDGEWVAFQSDRNSGTWDIYITRADGTLDEDIQATAGSDGDFYPAWSPDGSKIAFHSNRSGNMDIWVVDVADLTPTVPRSWGSLKGAFK